MTINTLAEKQGVETTAENQRGSGGFVKPLRLTAAMVMEALDSDRSPKSGWLREGGRRVWPQEACLYRPEGWLWVQASGRYVSGFYGADHVSRSFRMLDAWRIRKAIQRWGRTLLADRPLGARP